MKNMTRTTGERIRGKCLVTPGRSRPGGQRSGGRTNTAARIRRKCRDLADLLVRKSRSYGDSLLHPPGIFGKGDAEQLIGARLDDKICRAWHAPGAFGEDEIWDMLGYLVALAIVREDKARQRRARRRPMRA